MHAIHESNGVIVTATDDAILEAMRVAGRHGVFAEPAAAAAFAGVLAGVNSGMIGPQDRVLMMITGSGLKDTHSAILAAGKPIPIEPTIAAVRKH